VDPSGAPVEVVLHSDARGDTVVLGRDGTSSGSSTAARIVPDSAEALGLVLHSDDRCSTVALGRDGTSSGSSTSARIVPDSAPSAEALGLALYSADGNSVARSRALSST
jgi:hypothetical protein